MTAPSTIPTFDDVSLRLAEVSVRAARRLGRDLDRARRSGGPPPEALLADLVAAEAELVARRATVPQIEIPEQLPIAGRHDELLTALDEHQVVIVAGETGSGKSTQLPKLCLELGRGVRGLIGHTQPRRVAARTVAERVATELGTEIGDLVGYTVRFTDRVRDRTLVKVMTDGILLAETQRDRLLERYDTIIVDEAHERSLNIDFLLGYLRQLLPKRPDLKLVVTSATIDTERFAAHFGAPVVEVTGRTYPVEVRYRPIGVEPDDDRDQVQAVVDAVSELLREGDGDVLVFLSGEREIHDTADALRRSELRHLDVLPLYARLSAAEQHRVFQPHPGRRVILSTNVAETSLTVPGVRYVVDAGTARISRYSRRLKVQRLPIEPISQASANQRAGRCGRVAPGICIRLYPEADFAARDEFTEPEILRTNLASVILQMAALGLGNVAAFPFVDPPDPRSIADGVALLEELGAFAPGGGDGDRGEGRRLTPLGKRLAQIPVDPRLARMLLAADELGCAREVMIVVAALSIQDPRERPSDAAEAAAESHRRFQDERSDFLTLVRLWDHLRERQRELSSNQFRKLCRAEFLNYLRVREWQDLYSQLRQVASGLGIRLNGEPAHPDHVHRALLTGLLSQIGMRDTAGREVRGPRGARFVVAPGSSFTKRPPAWLMAGELVETNRLYARVVAPIRPEWAEQAAPHLVRRSYGEPRWEAARGSAVVSERVTLYGLPVVAARTTQLARVDRALAREMFIRHALVEADWERRPPLVDANRKVLEDVEALEARFRRPDLVIDPDALETFYARRVPDHVVSTRDFDRWWRDARGRTPRLLDLTAADVLGDRAASLDAAAFPEFWQSPAGALPMTYEFAPGSESDGATVHVPLAVLPQLDAGAFEWQVPGLRPELVGALVRSLPKPIRRHLTPVAEHARQALQRLDFDGRPLTVALAEVLSDQAGVDVRRRDFTWSAVPAHLRVTFAAVDPAGTVLGTSKDLDALRRHYRNEARTVVARATRHIEQPGSTAWTFGTIERVLRSRQGDHDVVAYPALVDDGETVSLRALATPELQTRSMRVATRKLLLLTLPSPRRLLAKRVTPDLGLALARCGAGTAGELVDACLLAAIDTLVESHGGPAWDDAGFRRLQAAVRPALAATASAHLTAAADVVAAAVLATRRLDATVAGALAHAVADERAHLARLVMPRFVLAHGGERLADVARYVRAIDRRLERAGSDVPRDAARTLAVQRLESELRAVEQRAVAGGPEIAAVRWMIEELRVSLFAQVLGTSGPVSEQRVRRAIAALAARD